MPKLTTSHARTVEEQDNAVTAQEAVLVMDVVEEGAVPKPRIKGAPTGNTFHGCTPSVDPGFMRKLKELDSTLDCYFDRDYCRFVITQRGRISGDVPVCIVGTDGEGVFRQPDEREIMMLTWSDLHRSGQEIKDRVRDGEEAMLEARRRSEEAAEDDIRYAAREDRRYAREQFARAGNMGKANSSVRRIEHKPKGYTVKDLRRVQ